MKTYDAAVIVVDKGNAFMVKLPLPNGATILTGTKPVIVDAECEIPRGKISEDAFDLLEKLRKAKDVVRIGIFPKAMFVEKDGHKGDRALLRLIGKMMSKICIGKKIAFVAVNDTITEGMVGSGEISGFALRMSWQAAIQTARMPSSFKERIFWGDLYPGP